MIENGTIRYVVGFLYSHDLSSVVLIRKKRPESQRGRLNGVGGKVQPGETARSAMTREFKEEAGLHVSAWKRMVCLTGPHFDVHFFCSRWGSLAEVSSQTDEQIEIHACCKRLPGTIISDLAWLVPMGRYLLAHPKEQTDAALSRMEGAE